MLFQNFFTQLPEHHQQLVKVVFLISGVYDLTPLIKTSVNDCLKLNEKTALKLSPQFQEIVAPQNLKFFVTVADDESPVFIEESKLFHERLKNLGYESQLIVFPNIDHFNIVENLTDESFHLTKLIIKSFEC